jgi:ABC-type uncharacterized transport system permease subunit
MPRQVVSLALTGLVVLTASVGAAPVSSEEPAVGTQPTVAVQRVVPQFSQFFKIRDEAAMVLVGTALIGLAAAVRRAA